MVSWYFKIEVCRFLVGRSHFERAKGNLRVLLNLNILLSGIKFRLLVAKFSKINSFKGCPVFYKK